MGTPPEMQSTRVRFIVTCRPSATRRQLSTRPASMRTEKFAWTDRCPHATLPHTGGGDGPPLAVMIGWLNSSRRHLSKYEKLYSEQGIDVISTLPRVDHVLKPEVGSRLMTDLLEALDDPAVRERPLLIHGFSVGGFLYAQLFRAAMAEPHRHGRTLERIIGQVFDSPPDYMHLQQGLGKALLPGRPIAQRFMQGALRLYRSVAVQATAEHKAASEVFHDTPVLAPALWFYSLSDPIAPPERCEAAINKWKGKGIDVTAIEFKDTNHVQHLSGAPEIYLPAFHSFLHKVCSGADVSQANIDVCIDIR